MSLPHDFVPLKAGDTGYLTWLEQMPAAKVVDPIRCDGPGALVELLEPADTFKVGTILAVRPRQFAVDVTR